MNQVYLSDIPRLFTAIAEWCACLIFLRRRPLRFSGPRLWGTLGLGLVVQCLFLCLTDGLPIPLWLPCMMGAVGLMFALIAACCTISLASAGYFTACAFLTAEFTASLEWQLWSYTQHTLDLPRDAWSTAALSLDTWRRSTPPCLGGYAGWSAAGRTRPPPSRSGRRSCGLRWSSAPPDFS